MKKYRFIVIILSAIVVIEAIGIIVLRKPVRREQKVSQPAKPVVVRKKGRIAVVIDDWGYNLNNAGFLKQIKQPLTLAILPNLAYSRKVSELATALDFEIILHLPMEPHEELRLEENTILTSMPDSRIKSILFSDLDNVVHAKGVSNHMGSSATLDTRVLSCVFQELKDKGMYFLDSFVSNGSKCGDLAAQMNLHFARRDVFLDNRQDYGYIKQQIDILKRKAQTLGQAVGIGHDRKLTLQVLKEMMPVLAKEGYEFVYLSELVD